jgi:hypothetical protein
MPIGIDDTITTLQALDPVEFVYFCQGNHRRVRARTSDLL